MRGRVVWLAGDWRRGEVGSRCERLFGGFASVKEDERKEGFEDVIQFIDFFLPMYQTVSRCA